MLKAIYAELKNGVIGNEGAIPWHLPDYKEITKVDMDIFKQYTMGQNIIMGYKTWESLGFKPLKGRKIHYIITSKQLESTEDIKYVTLEQILDIIKDEDFSAVIIGGKSIYMQLCKYCSEIKCNILHIKSLNDYKGDTKIYIDERKIIFGHLPKIEVKFHNINDDERITSITYFT